MNVHLNAFFIWNSCSFQTELPELLGVENKQTLPLFVESNTSQVFILSLGVFQSAATRDEWTVKFFRPSPLLIRKNWIWSRTDPQNFWKSSVRSSADPPV